MKYYNVNGQLQICEYVKIQPGIEFVETISRFEASQLVGEDKLQQMEEEYQPPRWLYPL